MDCVIDFKRSYFAAASVKQLNGGRCGEINTNALMTLLKRKLQHGLEIKIQQVNFKSRANNDDHGYLLLDSNIEDIVITTNREKVNAALAKITAGKICDPWNHGNFQDFTKEKSGFYSSAAGWDDLEIKTHTLNFAKFNQLSSEAKRFICREMSAIGLDLEPKDACRMFSATDNNPADSTAEKQLSLNREL